MTILTVNLGSNANDGTGDDLRTAFEKVNSGFTELDLTRVITAENLGTGAPVFLDKDSNILRFRSIKAGLNVSVVYSDDEITIGTADAIGSVEEDTSPKLGGDLNLNGFDIFGEGNIYIDGEVVATSFNGNLTGNVVGDVTGDVTGDLTGTVYGTVIGTVSSISNHDLKDLADVSNEEPFAGQALVWNGTAWAPDNLPGSIFSAPDYDFGVLGTPITNPVSLLLSFMPVDFDSITNPSAAVIDLGPIDPATATYTLLSTAYSIVEGQTITISLITSNIASGTAIPYTITGVDSSDIDGASLTGVFVINNNVSTLSITATEDLNLESPEVLILTLDNIIPTAAISIEIADLPSQIDGGNPNTTLFSTIVDGGNPGTIVFDDVIDGGEA